jgi:serine/threonine-protein kinase RsbW
VDLQIKHNRLVRKYALADKASLSDVRRQIRAELNGVGVDPAASFDCLVAVTEACTNALMHGHDDGVEDPSPEIHWRIDVDTAEFYVQDYSTQQWSRTSHPSWDAGDEIGEPEVRVGGFGLDLMRGLMDEVEIRIGPGGTTVCLVKKFEGYS